MIKPRGQFVTDKILETADHLFYFQGYSNTGINQVIDEADIAKGSLYKHFESKADLMVAYLERTHQLWFERFKGKIEKVIDPKEKLLAVFDHHLERQQVRAFGGCPFIKANAEAGMSDSRILPEIQSAKKRFKKFVGQLVAKSGHKKILTDKELTETICLLTEGGIALGSVFKQGKDLETAKKIIQKLI
ncbi:MAG TPA: TetR/AcrR family transcriptional regulator [Cyclobacteriaceae bacterium]|jgi:AcrR family transcriptional regulator|nr:TetR/AcrR family transcriptional regulator [Cyclobacteriaceae bacterium]